MPDSASNPRLCGRPRGSLSSFCLTREISNNNQMRGQLKGQGQLKEQTESEFHGETMGSCENTGTTKRARWSHEMKVFLIGLLHDYDVPGYRTQNAWSPDAWTKITAGVNEKFGVSFTNLQVKQKEQDLKKDYRSVKDLLEESGFGWDSDRNMVDAPDNVWASFLARRNSKDALKWRDRSFPYYDELSPLYEGRYAEGRTRQGMDHYASKANHGSVPKHGTDLSRSPSPTMPDPSQSDIATCSSTETAYPSERSFFSRNR